MASEILAPQPGIEPWPSAVRAWSLLPLDHQEIPIKYLLNADLCKAQDQRLS